jgi:hypothetical protein
MYFSMYLDNVVKGVGKTTGGMLVLFAVYPLFVLYDSYLNGHGSSYNFKTSPTPPSTPTDYSKIDDNEFHLKIKESLDKLF